MKFLQQNFLVLIIASVLVLVVLAVFFAFSSTQSSLLYPERIYPYDLQNHQPSLNPLSISDMAPNSVVYFMYPPDLSPIGNENHYQKFMLIRLPAWLDGYKDDISSFRAYSVVDLASHCHLKYWEQEGRQEIEDSCTSPSYRAIDGISNNWPNSNLIRAPSTGALPILELSAAKDGTIFVEPPNFSLEENGVVGIGREVTQSEFDEGTQFIQSQQKKIEEIISAFKIPKKLSTGHEMSNEYKETSRKTVNYSISEQPQDQIILVYEFCNCTKSFSDFLETEKVSKYSSFWSINGTDIYASPGKINLVNNTFDLYSFYFYLHGFRVEIATDEDFETGIKLILENFFPSMPFESVVKIK